MVEWAEQEHFEDEETKLSCPKIYLSTVLKSNKGSSAKLSHAASLNPDEAKTIVSNLQRELEAEATLANTMLGNLTRYSEQMRIREIQINNIEEPLKKKLREQIGSVKWDFHIMQATSQCIQQSSNRRRTNRRRSMISTLGEVHARLFVLSSSNRGRLLGFTDLMRQKKQKNETRRTNLALWDSRRLEVKQ
ncbi:hypothetical protein Tco_0658341 [Tanacetum coccineum]